MHTLPYSHEPEMDVPGFSIERLIAEGGMASVHLAVQESLGRRVALKILKKIDTPASAKRALNEGRIIASLNHRNVITIYDIGTVEDRHYIAMEYLEGGDLSARINGILSVEQSLDIIEKIGNCLAFVHGQGIVHRDLKPQNILLHKDGEPILTDFGIAKEVQADLTMTMDGTVMGSPHYISPEHADGRPLDERTDIYGLGIIFFEMLTGAKPYQGATYLEVILAHINEPIPLLPPHLRQYQSLLGRMIAKNAEDRFSNARELVDAVRELRSSVPSEVSMAPEVLPMPGSPSAVNGFAHLQSLLRSGVRDAWRTASPIVQDHVARPILRAVRTITDPQAQSAAKKLCASITRTSREQTVKAFGGIAQLCSNPHSRMATAGFAVVVSAILLSAWDNSDSDNINRDDTLQPITIAVESPAITESTRPETTLIVPQPGVPDINVESQVASAPAPEIEQQLQVYKALDLQLQQQVQQEVQRYLVLAEQALAQYRLTTPESDNAHSHYLAVLILDAGNERALAGLIAVADKYADLAEREIRKRRYGKARVYVNRGLGVQTDNPRLLALERTVTAPGANDHRARTPGDLARRISNKIESWFR